MIKRTCPACRVDIYSADTRNITWTCPVCRTEIPKPAAVYLHSSGAVTHRPRRRRRLTARFYVIMALVVGAILLTVLWDQIAPEVWATSPYWQAVLK